MKTKIIIEVESPDYHEVFPEEHQSMMDWEGKEKELNEHRKDFSKNVHLEFIKKLKQIVDKEQVEDLFLDDNEYYVEYWDKLEDYGIKFNLKERSSNAHKDNFGGKE